MPLGSAVSVRVILGPGLSAGIVLIVVAAMAASRGVGRLFGLLWRRTAIAAAAVPGIRGYLA